MVNDSIYRNRRGATQWLSWVLLVGFTVGISVFVYGWMVDQANKSATQMQSIVEDSSECDYLSIYVSSICQDAQHIYLNITNSNALDVDRIIFRTFDLESQPDMRNRSVSIRPQSTKELTVLKQGITKKLELIPMTQTSTKVVMCRKKMVIEENIKQC